MKSPGMLISILSSALSLGLLPGVCFANDPLRDKIGEVAGKIKKILDGRGAESCSVGQFNPPAQHPHANYGPGIENMLTLELQGLKIKVNREAGIAIQGEFTRGLIPADNRPNDVILLKLSFHVIDKAGDEITELPLRVEIRDNASLAKILGINGGLAPKGDFYQRNQDLQKNLHEKVVHIQGTKVFPRAESPFAVEVLVRPNAKADAKARQPSLDGNEVFVKIERDEIYEVVAYNQSHLEAAMSLHIDGLDVFTFSEVRDPGTGQPKYSRFVLPPNSKSTIYGWHKRDQPPDNILSFLVTEYGKGASRLAPQPTGKVGVITVSFAYAWLGDNPPLEARNSKDSGNETGLGPPISANTGESRRNFGVPIDFVSIRYSK